MTLAYLLINSYTVYKTQTIGIIELGVLVFDNMLVLLLYNNTMLTVIVLNKHNFVCLVFSFKFWFSLYFTYKNIPLLAVTFFDSSIVSIKPVCHSQR